MSENNLLKKYLLFLLCLFFLIDGKAQNEIGSPYSAYGLGYLSNPNNFRIKGMGNTGICSRENYNVNIANPASYTVIDTTSFMFEGGLNGRYVSLKAKGINEDASSANLDHILMGFPVMRWWKSSVGLVPFSKVGYHVVSYGYEENVGNLLYEYEGTGGISRVNWGNAFQPFKFLSVGINASYMFGTINRSQKITFPDSLYMIKTKVNNSVSPGDFYFDFGVQYFRNLKKDIKLVIGAVYRPQIEVNARDEFIARNFYIESSSYERFVDTIALSDTKGTITIPSGYGLGVSLSRTDRWFVGADYRFDNWSDYKSFGKTDSLVNSQSFSLGARLVPDYTSTSYLNRIDYRIGGQYFQSYLKLREKRINGYSVTFGIGLPMRSIALKGTRSMLNIGFEIGQIGSIEQNLIRENYINFSLGLTIYEVWFFKRRYK
jgi:long-subunit fatty acid transport protein